MVETSSCLFLCCLASVSTFAIRCLAMPLFWCCGSVARATISVVFFVCVYVMKPMMVFCLVFAMYVGSFVMV